ncbi:MAG: hypothetical protein GC192_24480 [Bacteroidetes bacterium]|nr:hypothetical protein [Bacteroidota bacterium]
MKKLLTLCLVAALLPYALMAQSSKKKKGTSILASTSFNYYSPLKPYTFSKRYFAQYNDLNLVFITHNSGTFTIEEGDSVLLTRTVTSKMPSNLVGIGASVQFRNLKNVYHELSITKLSFSKSTHLTGYEGLIPTGGTFYLPVSYNEKTFAFALRYELGKYFGRSKNAPLRFGISGGIEPSYYTYHYLPRTSSDFPLDAKLLTIDLSLIPMLSAKISKHLSLDFKFIPNFLMADFGNMKQNDPFLTKSQRGGTRIYKSPDITWAFSVQLRYMVKEAKKQRGKE